MTKEALPTVQEAMEEITTKPVVDLWPTVAVVLGCSRGAIYQAARNGEIDVVGIGKLRKAVTSSLRKKIGIGG